MKNRKRISAFLLMGALLCQLMTGCAPGRPQEPAAKAAAETVTGAAETVTGAAETKKEEVTAVTGEKVDLKWAVWSADSQPYWIAIAEEYMRQNPNTNIELVDLGATDYATALTTQLAGSDTPFDVVAIKDMASYLNLIGKGLLKPLDESKLEKEVYGTSLESLIWDDTYYTLPLRSDFYVMFYNKGVFDKAGVAYPTNDMTFEEYDQMVRSLTNTAFGQEVYGTHHHIWNSCVQGMAAVAEGKNTMDGDYEYMKPYYDMALSQQNDKVCMDYSTIKTSGLHYLGAFGQGNVATMLMGTWSIGSLLTRINEGQYPDLGEWAIASYPHKEGKASGDTLGNFVGVSVVKNSDHEEIAEDFVRFAGGPGGAEIVAEKGFMPGAMSDDVMDVIFAVKGFPTDEVSKEAILGVKEIYQETAKGENCPEISKILSTGHDYIMTGTMTVDEGIAYMNEEVAKIKQR